MQKHKIVKNCIYGFIDESYHRDSKPYIYTNDGYWFIGHFTNINKAIENAPNGYSCELYTTVKQIPYRF